MPSVLVETGFLTNPEEEDYLNSKEGQQEIAKCVTEAVKNYIAWLEQHQQSLNGNTQNDKSSPSNNTQALLDMVEAKEKTSF
jgi:N-acetylmuramoyl-L-alanine amidase